MNCPEFFGPGYRRGVKRIAIAGGIGSGKSAATAYLESKGYVVADADVAAREVVEKGKPAWQALRDAFGDAVLTSNGDLDRQFLADVAFNDASALKRLNHITHGAIGLALNDVITSATTSAVFVALPLFRPEHRAIFSLDEAWAIEVEPEIALDRLVRLRSMSDADARARLSRQMTNGEREAIVDVVLTNNDSLSELHQKIDAQLERSGL